MISFVYEIKKVFFNPAPILFVIIFLIVNAYMCHITIKRQTSEFSEDYKKAYDCMYQKVSGRLSLQNIEFVSSEKKRLNDIVLSGEYNNDLDLKNTYTGYLFSDNNLINNLYDDMNYCYNYSSFSNQIKKEALRNNKIYLSKDNTHLAEKYKFMSECFSNRQISSFYSTKGWYQYFDYSFSNLLIILIIIVGCSPIFSSEREKGTGILLKTTVSGKRIAIYKIIAVILFSFSIAIIFSLQDFIIFKYNYSLTGFLNPIYSIAEFKNTGLKLNIIEYLAFNFVAKCIGMFNISMLIIIISSFCKSDILSLLANFFVFIIHTFAYINNPKYSYISLLNTCLFSCDFSVCNLFGVIIHRVYFMVFLGVITFILFAVFCHYINLKKSKLQIRW